MSESEEESDESGGADERVLTAGPYRLDPRDERVWRDGEPLRLGGKAFALLRVLMERPQTLVTKDELFEKVWGGLAVSESVLTTAVKELRQALGDDARRPTVIETAHGRGYRFLLPVAAEDPGADAAEPVAGAATPPHARRRLAAYAAAAFAAVLVIVLATLGLTHPSSFGFAHPKSVAVLPFEDLSPGRSEQWFADGLTEEVMSMLARTRDLRVAAPGAVKASQADDLRRAAREAGVAHILTGAVRRSGQRLRVTADLVRASDGSHVWSQSYDSTSGDIISIQEDIGLQIARALNTATDPAKLRDMAMAGTRSVPAYEAYLRGLALERRQLDEGDVRLATAQAAAYEEARRLDPTFAAAHWRAADMWFGNATRVDAPPSSPEVDADRLAKFFERADAAIASSQDTTESLKYRAIRDSMQLRFERARDLMAAYLKARPRDIDAWEAMAELEAYVGDRTGVARAARRVGALSMEAGEPRSRAITLLVMADRPEEALALARRAARMRPESTLILYQGHRAAVAAGRAGEARAFLARLRGSALPNTTMMLAELRQACLDGRLSDAARLYDQISGAEKLSSRFVAAELYGDREAGLAALRPLDTPARLPTLMQFMIYPTFDAQAFPTLRARLESDGVPMPRPLPTRHGCPPRR